MQNNLDPTREDVLKVVDYINEQFSNQEWMLYSGNVDYFLPCTYVEQSGVYGIKLLGCMVWNTDNDDRLEYEDGTKVNLLQHILQELNKITTVLSGVE